MKASIELAKRAIAFERASAVYFPDPAKDMAELGSAVMAEEGVRYWISPGGDSITCTKCRLSSRNPHDVANRYCGSCHVFHDDEGAVDAERRIKFLPAWDKRSEDPRRNGGVHGVEIRMQLVSGDWAAELVLMTPWMLPGVQAWHKSLEHRFGARVTPMCDVAVHHRGGMGEFVVDAGRCGVFPDSRCENIPVSGFEGDRLYALLIEGGDEPVWAALADVITRERTRDE
jgi:hypothetical protein